MGESIDQEAMRSGQGPPVGALSHPWWEVAGRVCIGLWYGIQGLFLLAINIYLFAGSDWRGRITFGATGIVSLILLVAGVLSFRGRFGLSGLVLVLSLAPAIYALRSGSPATAAGVTGKGPVVQGIEAALVAFALFWIVARRLARSGRSRTPQRVGAVLLASTFLVLIPALGGRIGSSVGIVLMPRIPAEKISVNQRLPKARVRSMDGKPLVLDEPGVVYVVNFWATWCGPCRLELPHLLEMWRSWPKEGAVRLVAINTEALDKVAIDSFLEKEKLAGLPVYLDSDDLQSRLAFGTIPLTMLLKDGKVLALHEGFSRNLLPALSEEIRRALEEPKPGA